MIGSVRRDERGITHLLLVVAAVGVCAVIFGAGYLVFAHGTTKTPSSDTSASAFGKCLSATNNDNRICNFEKDYVPLNQTQYTATVNVTSPQGTVSNLTYSSDGKGDSEVDGNSDGQDLSSIVLGGATYIKVSGSGWIEYTNGATDAPAQIDPTASMDIAAGQSGVSFQYADTEACGSLTCYKYTVTDASQSGVTQNIWFDTTSYKLRQWSFEGSTGSTEMSIDYEPVTISAPSPISAVRQ